MPSVAEIAYFQVSNDYKAGTVSLNPTLAWHSKTPGLIRSYLGYEVEDPTVLFWVDVWTTKDAHNAFTNHPNYAKLVDESRPAFGSRPTVHLVEFEDTQGPFGAPITEFVTFTLKEGESIDELGRRIQAIHKALPGTPRFHGDSWNTIIGKPNVYHGILGWDTVEAHWTAVADGPLRKLIDEALAIADLWLVHAALGPFAGPGE